MLEADPRSWDSPPQALTAEDTVIGPVPQVISRVAEVSTAELVPEIPPWLRAVLVNAHSAESLYLFVLSVGNEGTLKPLEIIRTCNSNDFLVCHFGKY